MSAEDEYLALIERSERFMKSAERDIEDGYLDVASFSINQSLELFVKAMLLKLTGDYPHIHNLKLLLRSLSDNSNINFRGKIDRILAERDLEISLIQDAYVTSRYFVSNISEATLRKLKMTVKEIKGALGDVS